MFEELKWWSTGSWGGMKLKREPEAEGTIVEVGLSSKAVQRH